MAPVEAAKAPALPEALAQSAGFLLNMAATAVRAKTAEVLVRFDLLPRHCSILQLLAEQGPCSQLELGARLQIDKASMVGLLDVLETRGLLTRERDPEDRRYHRVALTKQGRAVTAEAMAACDEVQARFLSRIPPDEWEVARRVLLKLLEGALAEDDGAG